MHALTCNQGKNVTYHAKCSAVANKNTHLIVIERRAFEKIEDRIYA
jgi:hypothetical protein